MVGSLDGLTKFPLILSSYSRDKIGETIAKIKKESVRLEELDKDVLSAMWSTQTSDSANLSQMTTELEFAAEYQDKVSEALHKLETALIEPVPSNVRDFTRVSSRIKPESVALAHI